VVPVTRRRVGAKVAAVLRFGLIVLIVAAGAYSLTTPATAQQTSPSLHEYDSTALLLDGNVTTHGGVATLALDGTAQEGNSVVIELQENRSAFEIASATDATGSDIGIDVNVLADAIEVTITDLSGEKTLNNTEIAIGVKLTASDEIASDADAYNSTPVATVVSDETDSELLGTDAIAVSVSGAAEIGFDADAIDSNLRGSNLQLEKQNSFVISFSDRPVKIQDGDSVNISINSDVINQSDSDGLRINAKSEAVEGKNITDISVSTSQNANVLEGYNDQITITFKTSSGDPKIVSGEAVSVLIQVAIETEPMKSTADRYSDVDLFRVDVEGEDNAELTDNDDIKTKSPVIFDIYPGEASTNGFDLGNIESGEEFGDSEGRTIAIDGLEDRFGNEITEAEFTVTLEEPTGTQIHEGVWLATDGSENATLGRDGDFDVPLGVFNVSVEVTNVTGPATQSKNTGEAVTETATEVLQYPDNVTLRTTTPYGDFDLGPTGRIEVAVDLGVADADIGRVDLQLRRETGAGDVTFNTSRGSPTATDLWETTGYAGDGHLGDENPWAIERGLTSADFDGGVRRYVVDADAADSYNISVAVMPHEASVTPDSSELETSLAADPNGTNRDTVGIVATGAIASVGNVSVPTGQEFVGTDVDEGRNIDIDLSGFTDENGNAITNTSEEVPVRFGGANVAAVGPTGGNDSIALSVDPTAINSTEIDVGTEANVTVEVDGGYQRNGTGLTMVHRAIERSENAWRVGSIPQPATIYVDASGPRDLAHWDAENGSYESFALDASGDTLESYQVSHEQLHRGFYAYAENSSLRIGFEYATDPAESIGTGELDLGNGWHLASSNYNVSAHSRRDLDTDLIWAETTFEESNDTVSVWDRQLNRLHPTSGELSTQTSTPSIDHDDVYWINVDRDEKSSLSRVIRSPIFVEREGVQE
jgi:hypothetical protein